MMQPSASLHQDAVYLDPQSAHENWYYNGLVNIRKHLGGSKPLYRSVQPKIAGKWIFIHRILRRINYEFGHF